MTTNTEEESRNSVTHWPISDVALGLVAGALCLLLWWPLLVVIVEYRVALLQ